MPLHSTKRIALQQLCNCISSTDVPELTDLSNGDFFLNVIRDSFKDFLDREESKHDFAVFEVERMDVDEIKTEAHEEINTEAHEEIETEAHEEIETEAHEEIETEAHEEIETEAHAEIETEAHAEIRTEAPEYIETEASEDIGTEVLEQLKTETSEEMKTDASEEIQIEAIEDLETRASEVVQPEAVGEVESVEDTKTRTAGRIITRRSSGKGKTEYVQETKPIEAETVEETETRATEKVKTRASGKVEIELAEKNRMDHIQEIKETVEGKIIEKDAIEEMQTTKEATPTNTGRVRTRSSGKVKTDDIERVKGEETKVETGNIKDTQLEVTTDLKRKRSSGKVKTDDFERVKGEETKVETGNIKDTQLEVTTHLKRKSRRVRKRTSRKRKRVIEESKTEDNDVIMCAEAKNEDRRTSTKLEDVGIKSKVTKKDSKDSVEIKGCMDDGIDKKVLQKFKIIESFIDEKYSLKSEEMVLYSACMKGDELELSKVACFVLSEVVNHFIHIKNDQLRTLQHLDSRVQEDLEECFRLFITERKSLSKAAIEKILCYQTRYKYPSPAKRGFVDTPKRNCTSKYKCAPTTPPIEIFTNSPLKSFFESPVFKKEDIIKREKELAKIRNSLYIEEAKHEELKLELVETKKKLKMKDEEIKQLKENAKIQTASARTLANENKGLQKEIEGLKQANNQMKNDYEKENTELFTKANKLQNELKAIVDKNLRGRKVNVVREALMKTEKVKRQEKMIQSLKSQLDIVTNDFKEKQEEANELRAELHSAKFDLLKNESMFLSKLKEAKNTPCNEPGIELEPSVSGENIGSIIEEENRNLQIKLGEAELKIAELENQLREYKMAQLNQNNVPKSKNALSMPQLLDMSELQNHQVSKRRHSNKFKELVNSNNSRINSENSVHKTCGETAVSENMAEPVRELYGVLWRNLKHSFSDTETDNAAPMDDKLNMTENTNVIENLSLREFTTLLKKSTINVPVKNNYHDVFADKDSDIEYLSSVLIPNSNNSRLYISKLVKDFKMFKELLLCLFIFVDSQCSLPNKKCCNCSAIHLENGRKKMEGELNLQKKLVKEHAIMLEKKEEEIDTLKTDVQFFQRQLEDQKMELLENSRMIEDLKHSAEQMETTGKMYYTKYEKCKEHLFAMKERMKSYEPLYNKLKDAELEKQKLLEKYESISEKFRIYRRKSEQESECLKDQINQLKIRCNIYEKKIKDLKTQIVYYMKKIYVMKAENSAVITSHGEDELQFKKEQTVSLRDIKSNVNVSYSKSESLYVDLNATTSRSIGNESTMSGALYNKRGLEFQSAYEEDFLNHSSLDDIKKEYDDERSELLKKRNSILPLHLQSCYAIEANLRQPPEAFYVKNQQNVDNLRNGDAESQHQADNENNRKRIKLCEEESDTRSNESSISTPVVSRVRVRKIFKTPSSLKKLLNFDRRNRPAIIKPKT